MNVRIPTQKFDIILDYRVIDCFLKISKQYNVLLPCPLRGKIGSNSAKTTQTIPTIIFSHHYIRKSHKMISGSQFHFMNMPFMAVSSSGVLAMRKRSLNLNLTHEQRLCAQGLMHKDISCAQLRDTHSRTSTRKVFMHEILSTPTQLVCKFQFCVHLRKAINTPLVLSGIPTK